MAVPDTSETGEHMPERIEQAAQSLVFAMAQATSDLSAVSGAQLAALSAIARRGSLNLAQLAEELGTIPSWASRLCDRLEADGYIERRLNETGRRQVTIKLRTPGRRLLGELQRRRTAALVPVVEQMSAAERKALLRGLEAFDRVCHGEAASSEQSA